MSRIRKRPTDPYVCKTGRLTLPFLYVPNPLHRQLEVYLHRVNDGLDFGSMSHAEQDEDSEGSAYTEDDG